MWKRSTKAGSKLLLPIIPVIIFLSVRLAVAGDIWVYPEKFAGVSRGDTLAVQVGRGQLFPRSDERVITEKLKLHIFSSGGGEYLVPLKEEKQFWAGKFTVKGGGAHLVAAEILEDYWSKTGEKWVNLPKNKVPASKQGIAFWYLSKAVLSQKRDGSLYRKNLGYPLEIIPQDNPALIKPGMKMRLKVVFDAKPASGIAVEATYVGFSRNPEVKVETARTDSEGMVDILIRQHGLWYITTKKYIRQKNNIQYDSASYQSNLMFQIQPATP